ncbi:Bxi1p RNJ42_05112 [Nakaseomyces bracarensis]|uniref:Bxi1p n=1 Tax=Nakaseomyces bracarensis TaxID=273131 RepID=UPI0038713657
MNSYTEPDAPPPYQVTDPYNIPDDFKWSTNVTSCEPLIRQWFLHKVYTILSTQLLATLAFGVVMSKWEPLSTFAMANMWVFYVALVGSLGSCIWLSCGFREEEYFPEEHEGDKPWYYLSKRAQYGMLGFFTLCEAYTISLVCLLYDPQTVLSAIVITTCVVGGISLLALSEKMKWVVESASSIYFWLNWGLLLLIGVGIASLFFGISSGTDLLISIVGAVIFTLYLLIDTQMIFRKVRPDEEIKCAMVLYLDIINLFLNILRIMARRNDD